MTRHRERPAPISYFSRNNLTFGPHAHVSDNTISRDRRREREGEKEETKSNVCLQLYSTLLQIICFQCNGHNRMLISIEARRTRLRRARRSIISDRPAADTDVTYPLVPWVPLQKYYFQYHVNILKTRRWHVVIFSFFFFFSRWRPVR